MATVDRYVEGVTAPPQPEDVVLIRNGGGRLTARFWLEYVGSWEDFCRYNRRVIAIVRQPVAEAGVGQAAPASATAQSDSAPTSQLPAPLVVSNWPERTAP